VSSFLRDAGADARIEEFSAGTPTAAEAAAAVGCALDQIVKTLVFVCEGGAVVALVPGDRRADPAKVARAAGTERVRVAKADEVQAATGFEPGAVAPFPLPDVETVLMERALLRHKVVWAGAGSEKYLVGLSPADLSRLARARTLDIATDYDSPGEKEN
jgi:Cys-tRNA(Pro) deacylase